MSQERIPQVVYQLQIRAANEARLKLARIVLLNLGYKEDEIVLDSRFRGNDRYNTVELYGEDGVKFNRIKEFFGRLKLSGIKVFQRRLAPKDWLTRWKANWKPAALTKKLDVVPVWCRDKYKPRRGRDYLLMDTLLSFGTGLHETTRIMAQLIEDNRGRYKSFLDIGTGTGILAMVAIKHGADEVMGFDIGELSVQAAHDNMKANGLYFKVVKADIGKYRLNKTFDFVAANLITGDLIDNGRRIIRFVKKGGLLAVSGISLENLSQLRRAFAALPLKCLKVVKGKQWSGLLYQKMT